MLTRQLRIGLLATSGFLTAASAQGDVVISTLPGSISAAPRMSFITQTTSNSADNVVGAFAIRLLYDPAVVKILAISPAAGSPFVNNLFLDASSFTSGQTRVVGFQTTNALPFVGEQAVCIVRWQPIGTSGSSSAITAAVETLVDATWQPAAVTSAAGQFSIDGTDSDSDEMADVWETARGLNPNNANDAALDSDGDGNSNLAEYYADTDPQDRNSNFHIVSSEADGAEFVIRFATVLGRTYRIECKNTLAAPLWETLVGNIAGTGQIVEVRDPNGLGLPSRFYRALSQ